MYRRIKIQKENIVTIKKSRKNREFVAKTFTDIFNSICVLSEISSVKNPKFTGGYVNRYNLDCFLDTLSINLYLI